MHYTPDSPPPEWTSPSFENRPPEPFPPPEAPQFGEQPLRSALPPVDPANVLPVLPGPNVGMSVLWVAFFLGCQVAMAIVIGVVIGMTGQRPSESVLHAVLIGFNLLVSLVIARTQLGRNAKSLLGVRSFRPLHLGIVLALVIPLAMSALLAAGIAGASMIWLAEIILPHEAAEAFKQYLSKGHPELQQAVKDDFWLMVVFVGFVTGVAEEVFFRGFLSRGMVARHGLLWGSFFTATLFGLAHLHPVQFFATFLIGIAFQVIFLTARSLWLPILAHALHNTVVMFMTGLEQDEVARLLGNGVLLTCVPTTALLLWLLCATRTKFRMPDRREWFPGYFTAEVPPKELGLSLDYQVPPPKSFVHVLLLCGLIFYLPLAINWFSQ
jgi:membrane protease YdiL (CAAX protease family)